MISQTSPIARAPQASRAPTAAAALCPREIFFSLVHAEPKPPELAQAQYFLEEQLALGAGVSVDLPDQMEDLEAWMLRGVEATGQRFTQYLAERAAGGGRMYFPTRAHALYFLRAVAPTKLVDGAWLYGMVPHWQEARFLALVRTYLEELGEGEPTKNHVAIYRRLLDSVGCTHWEDLPSENYVQGAIQLALAYQADHFLPEIIGYNLGYEQLPLHLLITAHELKELGIDPYYFTLHITVDNADSGHARQAVAAVFDALPRVGDAEDFWRRVHQGYRLNELGANTNSVIASFDLKREVRDIFARKSVTGRSAHPLHSRVAGRPVNDWLADADEAGALMESMAQAGWFRWQQDPRESRFWKLLQGEKAKMYGVFSPYEQQVIFDWMAGDRAPELTKLARPVEPAPGPHFSAEELAQLRHPSTPSSTPAAPVLEDDFDAEVQALQEALAACATPEEQTATLIALMSPARHHTSSGLAATRLFCEILG